jgi:apolipoprotein D and lipocalin family protein
MKRNEVSFAICITMLVVLSSCVTLPNVVTVIGAFEKEKYLGKWFEIARYDFAFEKNLNNTTAEYSIRKDGKISVTNRGFNYITKKWSEAKGKARFKGTDTKGELEVSFFGPFYGDYNIIALDKDYQYALVAGSSLKYLWILSREKAIPSEVKEQYLSIANSLGYETSKLIWVEHDK